MIDVEHRSLLIEIKWWNTFKTNILYNFLDDYKLNFITVAYKLTFFGGRCENWAMGMKFWFWDYEAIFVTVDEAVV